MAQNSWGFRRAHHLGAVGQEELADPGACRDGLHKLRQGQGAVHGEEHQVDQVGVLALHCPLQRPLVLPQLQQQGDLEKCRVVINLSGGLRGTL